MKKEETLGRALKKARLKLGLTFEEIYKDLRIHPKILKALEEDKIDPHIGEVYIKGFLKKYAGFLGFETDKVLYSFTQRPPLREPLRGPFIDIDKKKSPPLIIKDRFRKSILPLTAIIALALTISLISYAGAQLIIEFKKFRPRLSRTLTGANIKRIAERESPNVKGLGPFLAIPQDQPLILKVATKDKVWLRVKSDGKVIFEHTLPKGSVEKWQAQDGLELWVGRAEKLDLTLNNNYLGSPGRGRIRKIIIDRKGLRIEKR